MKTRLHLTSLFVTAALFAGSAFAHPEGHGEDLAPLPKPKIPARPALVLPSTESDTLAAIQRQADALKKAFDEGMLPSVRANAATLNELVQHLTRLVPAEQQTTVKEIAERQAKLTADLAKAAAAGAQKEVGSLISKIADNLSVLNPRP
jgi:hypothetical protein